jgi:TRAP-type C4-dicarboxylate transport system substrate-binding protein
MKKKQLKIALVLALALAVAMSLLTACGGGGGDTKSDKEQTFKWKLQSSYGPGDQTWDIQMPMIVDAIEKASGGRIKITTYQPGAICEPEQAPESVKNGLLECAMSAGADDAVVVPAAISELGIPY